MKILFITLLLTTIISSCNQNPQNKINGQQGNEPANNSGLKLQIYYFHLTNRCPTCNSIEANVKKVLDKDFKNEIEKGVIALQVLNVDEEKNKPLAEKYQAYGASLYLVSFSAGREVDNDLTDFAFSYSRNNPEVFLKGISDTIKYFINH